MTWLLAGLALWIVAHLFKRVLPRQRDAMGKAGRPVIALVIIAGVVLMVMGYREAETAHLWALPEWTWHVNNLAMFVAIFFMDIARSAGVVRTKVRHPMLSGVIIWGLAHLLVNGDVASLVLFGGLALWAWIEMLVINAAEGAWVRPEPGPVVNDLKFVVLAAVIYAAIVGVHFWLGYPVIAVLR